MSSYTQARFSLLAAAILFSTGGAAIKMAEFSAWQVASFRSAIAAVFLCVALPAARRHWTWRTVAVAVPYGATLVLFVVGNKLTTAANTIFLQSTAPLYVLFLGRWLLGEHARRRDLFFASLFAAGLLMLVSGHQVPLLTAPSPARGNLIAALSGLTWALTVIGLRWLVTIEPRSGGGTAAPAIVCGNALACLAALPWALPVPVGSITDWGTVVYLGAFQIGVAYVLVLRGVARLTALEISLLLLVEPVLSTVWAWLLHGEQPGLWSLAGGALILLTAATKTLVESPIQLYLASTPRDSP
jgi:drug/metabolite transporter (DMT)-like permease